MNNIRNIGKSIRTRLLNIAKKENIFFQTILTRYFQERLLYRMSLTQYKSNFYLKGGALMYALEKHYARPTLDIDFLGNNISNESEKIIEAFKHICNTSCEEDGVHFDVYNITSQHITEFKDYRGIRLNIPVSMDTITQVLTMDIGFGDIVTPTAIPLDYPTLIENLPEAKILAYSIETVIAEKMHALIDLAEQNSRMKDYYDLYFIMTKHIYDATILNYAIQQTFENRHTKYQNDTAFFRAEFSDNSEMHTKWNAFIRKISGNSELSFKEVTQFLQIKLKPYWENLKN